MNDFRVNSVSELEALYAKPLESSVAKVVSGLNEHYRTLIQASPFALIASVAPEGLDCSPRGDAPGFVRILDDQTLAIPDRRGNNRLDTLRNIIADPRVALLFMIPGVNETLRVNGQAHLSVDPELIRQFEINGKTPATVIVVNIEQVYFQCARALKRSQLWNPTCRIDRKTLPSTGTLIRSALADFDAEAYDSALDDRQAKSLY